jgi:feruloyl esterase
MGKVRAAAWVLATALGLSAAGAAVSQRAAPAEQPVTPTLGCEALAAVAPARLSDPTTVITSAKPQPATATAPEHCELFGKLQERAGALGQTYAIKFHMRLPSRWNGRFFFQGGGGSNGVVGNALGNLLAGQTTNALSLGYAVVSQDFGHDNAVNNDPARQGVVTFGWDAEARRNYGGASIGPVAGVAKALIGAYYGQAPRYSYYVGGSKGGQEAMMAAQRFPEMFNGIIAGYPGFRLAYAGAVGQMWDAQAFAAVSRKAGALDAEGLPLVNKAFSDEDLALVSGAVLKACDDLDGTHDGMVENFTACTAARVAPALAAITCREAKTPACLNADQVAALRKVYGGAKGPKGEALYASWPWDAGIGGKSPDGYYQGWRSWKLGKASSDHNDGLAVVLGGGSASAVFTSPPTQVADTPAALTRYALGVDVADNARKAQVKWGSFNESAVDFMNATSTDLSRFTSRGGKLLIFQGVSDPVFSINDTIAWLRAVDAHEGGRAGRFVRLFAVPGMNHGGGGPSTDQFDAFSALVAWTEQGRAPTQLVAHAHARAASPWPGRTRLLCPYPEQPRRVAADIESAASFHCVLP